MTFLSCFSSLFSFPPWVCVVPSSSSLQLQVRGRGQRKQGLRVQHPFTVRMSVKVLSSALPCSIVRWRAQLGIQKMLPASRARDVQSGWLNILGWIILPCANPLKIACVFMNISQSTWDLSGLTHLFLMRPLGAWGAVLCLRGPTGRG